MSSLLMSLWIISFVNILPQTSQSFPTVLNVKDRYECCGYRGVLIVDKPSLLAGISPKRKVAKPEEIFLGSQHDGNLWLPHGHICKHPSLSIEQTHSLRKYVSFLMVFQITSLAELVSTNITVFRTSCRSALTQELSLLYLIMHPIWWCKNLMSNVVKRLFQLWIGRSMSVWLICL